MPPACFLNGLSNPEAHRNKTPHPKGGGSYLVGVSGFEPEASWTRTKRDTKLRHTPKDHNIIMRLNHLVKGYQVFLPDFSRKMFRGDGMSYRIEYGTAMPAKFQQKKRKSYVRALTALCILFFSLGVGKIWPDGRQVLQKFLLPGEPSVTEQAFSTMVSDLTDGVSLEDAMVVFCQQILEHGKKMPS